jgi:hypothetical protein
MSKTKTPSKSSPKGGRRGCLCENGTYSSKCCDGSLQAQGIGTTTGTENVSVTISSGVTTIVRQNG